MCRVLVKAYSVCPASPSLVTTFPVSSVQLTYVDLSLASCNYLDSARSWCLSVEDSCWSFMGVFV